MTFEEQVEELRNAADAPGAKEQVEEFLAASAAEKAAHALYYPAYRRLQAAKELPEVVRLSRNWRAAWLRHVRSLPAERVEREDIDADFAA